MARVAGGTPSVSAAPGKWSWRCSSARETFFTATACLPAVTAKLTASCGVGSPFENEGSSLKPAK